MLSKVVAVGALSLGLMGGLAGIAGADPIVPGPHSVGPFTQSGEPTGKAACQQASIASGHYSGCFEYPSGSGKWFYNPPSAG
ncbi:hypothetical protein K7711_30130 [Nocardia sp. CA2R105]|uniref:hypothetical protein n=1 Tax=Nocardia coffeae TaxID=2873381 RepID=UPI001CA7B17A|nr:hypothetical protein [Nocardia coffeae]MBY8860766.1 hypothetical protein [Nocardia coffeae]